MTEHEKELAREYWSHTVPKRLLDEEKKNTMENDKEFLNWIYERMINVHGEKDM